MNRRMVFLSIAAAGSMTAASQARQTLANRPLPYAGDSGAKDEHGSGNKRKRRKRGGRDK